MREYSGFFMRELTPKQEKFCQLYIELGNASEAYRLSYDAEDMNSNTVNKNASVLLDNPKITTRLAEIKKQHQSRHNLTVDHLLIELEEARQAALGAENPQSSAAVAATMGKAKLLGLDKQVIDHTSSDGSHGRAINIGADTTPEVLDALAAKLGLSDDGYIK